MLNSDATGAVLRQLRGSQRPYDMTFQIPLGDGENGVVRTVGAMRAIIRDAADSPTVHQFASTIAASVPNRSRRAQLYALDQTMRDLLHFKEDTKGREVLRHPDQLLHEIGLNGVASCDCDDQTMLGAATLRALGFNPAIVTIVPPGEDEFKHVHFAALLHEPEAHLFPLDPQERIPPGTWTPAERRRAWWA